MGAFTIRQALSGDYKGIVDCLLTVRGPMYYQERMYDVNYLKESRDYIFFIAVTDKQEAVGCVALSRDLFDPSICLMCMLTVKQEFTRKGAAKALFERALAYITDYPMLKTHIVTKHSYIQGMAEKYGFVPTGLLPVVRYDSMHTTKSTLAIYIKRGTKINTGNLFVHKSISGITSKVYNSLGVDFEVFTDGRLEQTSTINHFYDAHNSVTYMQICECGKDLSGQVAVLLEDYKKLRSKTINLILNISSLSAVVGYEMLCEMGFIFSGFNPLGNEHEYIVMFYGGLDIVRYEDIKATEKLNELIKEVIAYE